MKKKLTWRVLFFCLLSHRQTLVRIVLEKEKSLFVVVSQETVETARERGRMVVSNEIEEAKHGAINTWSLSVFALTYSFLLCGIFLWQRHRLFLFDFLFFASTSHPPFCLSFFQLKKFVLEFVFTVWLSFWDSRSKTRFRLWHIPRRKQKYSDKWTVIFIMVIDPKLMQNW